MAKARSSCRGTSPVAPPAVAQSRENGTILSRERYPICCEEGLEVAFAKISPIRLLGTPRTPSANRPPYCATIFLHESSFGRTLRQRPTVPPLANRYNIAKGCTSVKVSGGHSLTMIIVLPSCSQGWSNRASNSVATLLQETSRHRRRRWRQPYSHLRNTTPPFANFLSRRA